MHRSPAGCRVMSTIGPQIERAAVDDQPSILQLLSRRGLPVDGLVDHLDTTFVARVHGDIVGCAALEMYPDGALLRSVAVDASLGGQGIGTQLTKSALALAAARGIRTVFLLTTTAETFFPKFGFVRITRDQVPPSVLESVEFRSACPASAIVMQRVSERPV
jgi:amino-acid N-acetyltransferase